MGAKDCTSKSCQQFISLELNTYYWSLFHKWKKFKICWALFRALPCKFLVFFLHSLKNEISSIFSPIALSPFSSFQLLSRLQLYPHFQGLMVHTTCENDCNFSSVCFFGKILFASTVDVAFCTYQLHLFHKNSHLNSNTVIDSFFP